jgi:hypothetical protein
VDVISAKIVDGLNANNNTKLIGGLNMEERKDVYCKFTYKCGICGKEYNNVLDRAKCEIDCSKKAEEEAKKAADLKKKEEQKVRKTEVDAAFEHLHKLVTAYVEDYGYYNYGEDGGKGNFYWPSRLFNRIWD